MKPSDYIVESARQNAGPQASERDCVQATLAAIIAWVDDEHEREERRRAAWCDMLGMLVAFDDGTATIGELKATVHELTKRGLL